MVSKPAQAHVQFAVLEPLTLANKVLGDAIRASIVPGTGVTRYERAWRMGQYEEEGDYLFGRIGFQAQDVTELWNESKKDFEEAGLQAGTTSPFVIRMTDGRIGFQRRPGVIEPTTFTSNLQALMNEASPLVRWRVSRETYSIPWDEWTASVTRVTELHFRLLRPNPHYGQRKRVEDIIEGTNAHLADIALRASEDQTDGLDLDDDLVAQAIDHATDYGSYRAEGERPGEDKPVVWYSDREVVPERTIEADPKTHEASPEALKGEIEDRPALGTGDRQEEPREEDSD